MRDTSFHIKLSGKNEKNGCLDIENQALTKDDYFRKDLSFCILILTNIWMFRWTFRNPVRIC